MKIYCFKTPYIDDISTILISAIEIITRIIWEGKKISVTLEKDLGK